jgi:hypothetical protein
MERLQFKKCEGKIRFCPFKIILTMTFGFSRGIYKVFLLHPYHDKINLVILPIFEAKMLKIANNVIFVGVSMGC